MQAYKIIEQLHYATSNGRIELKDRYVLTEGYDTYLLATPLLPQMLMFKPHSDYLEPVEILEIPWVHPHLPKKVKKKVYEILQNNLQS